MTTPVTIAMWSGPRNLSTALMRSFENRPDCAVWDEPFYIPYLLDSGVDHPMRNEVIHSGGEQDWRAVIRQCLSSAPDATIAQNGAQNGTQNSAPIFYQKHMTHHMRPRFDRDWICDVTNVFLIRAPERIVTSYARKRESASLHDIGFVEQKELFDLICDRNGAPPVVIKADDIQLNPKRMLTALCDAIGILFDDNMLKWPIGRRDSDGVWAAHWYNAVIESTGFKAPRGDPPPLNDTDQRLADSARPYYDALSDYALKPEGFPQEDYS